MKKKTLTSLLLLVALIAIVACGNSSDSADERTLPYVDANQDGDIDWSLFPIIIDGHRGVAANWHTAEGEDFPTHVPLLPVAAALGVTVDIAESFPPEVTMNGLLGSINFTVGTYYFSVDGNLVELWQPSLLIDGEIYVPIPFFRDVYGMGRAAWMSGHVHLDMEPDDMH